MLAILKDEAGCQADNEHFFLYEKYDFERSKPRKDLKNEPKKVCPAMNGSYNFLHRNGTKFPKG